MVLGKILRHFTTLSYNQGRQAKNERH